MKNLYLILDESGNLHKNSSNRYFIIGGYLTDNALKARQTFKKELSVYRKENSIKDTEEIKGSTIKNIEKKEILTNISNKMVKNNFYIPVFIIVDKNNLKKPIKNVNILYNYFIKILLKRLNNLDLLKDASLILKLDNKTIKVGSINTLEEYLQGEFFFEDNINIEKVNYLESKNNFEIQLADFICNYYWRCFEYSKVINENLKFIDIKIVYFPYKEFGK